MIKKYKLLLSVIVILIALLIFVYYNFYRPVYKSNLTREAESQGIPIDPEILKKFPPPKEPIPIDPEILKKFPPPKEPIPIDPKLLKQ